MIDSSVGRKERMWRRISYERSLRFVVVVEVASAAVVAEGSWFGFSSILFLLSLSGETSLAFNVWPCK